MSEPRKIIDWANVKDRLRRSQLALEKALAHDPDRDAAVYRERASQLAKRRAGVETGPAALRVLTFGLGDDRYGFDFADVAELLPFIRTTPVPGAPAALLGVINVHGEIQSVVDLGRLMEIPGREVVTDGFVLLLRRCGAALRVDRLDKVQLAPVETLVVPEAAQTGYVRGLAADRLRLLNTQAILAHPLFQVRTPS
jgi:purine-binding chemotaxis protein CheW